MNAGRRTQDAEHETRAGKKERVETSEPKTWWWYWWCSVRICTVSTIPDDGRIDGDTNASANTDTSWGRDKQMREEHANKC